MVLPTLLISSVSVHDDPDPGGLYALQEGHLERLDELSTTGIASTGERLYRLLHDERVGSTWLYVYGQRGLLWRAEIREATDVHDIVPVGDRLAVVSTGTNTLLWLHQSGIVVGRLRFPGVGDAWHLNCLAKRDGRLFVTAFAREADHRGWDTPLMRSLSRYSGCLTDVDRLDESPELTSLNRPHHPRWVDGGWLICESGTRRVLHFVAGQIARSVNLDAWVRGVAITPDYLLVGESLGRHNDPMPASTSAIVVIDRRTWEVLDRIPLPFNEAYDIVPVDPAFIAAIRLHASRRPASPLAPVPASVVV